MTHDWHIDNPAQIVRELGDAFRGLPRGARQFILAGGSHGTWIEHVTNTLDRATPECAAVFVAQGVDAGLGWLMPIATHPIYGPRLTWRTLEV